MRSILSGAVVVAAAALALAGGVAAQAPANAAAGVYTADQATKGTQTFMDNCSGCHGVDFAGGAGAPSLKGPEFMFGWTGKNAGELFTYIHDKMPPGQAGSLSDQQYTEIVAALLKANGFPAGSTPLPDAKGAANVTIK